MTKTNDDAVRIVSVSFNYTENCAPFLQCVDHLVDRWLKARVQEQMKSAVADPFIALGVSRIDVR